MIYVFRCEGCGHEFEITASVAEYESRGVPACPRCGRAGTRRVFTPILVMTGAAKAGSSAPPGGCCGGACGCRH